MAVNDELTREQMQAKWPDNPHLDPERASRGDRAKALIEGYAHGLAHGAPRSSAELEEIKALLAD